MQYDSERVTLLIPEAQFKDAGTYILSARNSLGVAYNSCIVTVKGRLPYDMSDSEKAAEATVTVAEPVAVPEPVKPTVQTPLKDVSVDEGKTAQLDCVITGQPEPEVIWYHDDQPVKESADVQLLFQDDRCSLVLQEAVADDVGEYKVVAINSAGEASSQCKLTVVAKAKEEPKEESPVPEPQQSAVVEEIIEEVVVVEEGEGDGDYEEVVIEEEEEIIEEEVPSQTAVVEEETAQSVLVVDDAPEQAEKAPVAEVAAPKEPSPPAAAAPAPSAKIEDVVSSSGEEEEETEEEEEVLTSESVAPQFDKLLSDILTDENETVRFEVVVKGEPVPTVKWFLNNNELSENDRISFSKTADGAARLVIKNVSANDKGVYTVKAANSCGEAKSFSHLIVKSINAPESLQIPDQQALVDEKQVSPTFKEKFFDSIANID